MEAEQDYRGGLSAEDLVYTIQHLLGAERGAMRLTCRYLADLADRMEHRRGPGGGGLAGYADVYHAARCLFGLGAHTVRERIRVGRALRSLPRIEEAFLSGELSYSRTREVTRVATAENESGWILLGRELSIRTLERRVAEAAGKSPKARTADATHVHLRRSETAGVTLQLPAETWALLQQAMEGARRASQAPLGDVEALEAVARDALARLGADDNRAEPGRAVVLDEPQSLDRTKQDTGTNTRATSSHVASHSGTSVSGTWGAGTSAPDASRWSGSAQPASHSPSVSFASHSGSVPQASHSGTAGVAAQGGGEIMAELGESDSAPTLLALLGKGGAWSVDALVVASGLHVSKVQAALVMLEIAGRVQRGWGGDYGIAVRARGVARSPGFC
ncbi:MAG: hypothetical protein R3B70_43115 [Polyangiaceae bacterium]